MSNNNLSTSYILTAFVVGVGLALAGIGLYTYTNDGSSTASQDTQSAHAQGIENPSPTHNSLNKNSSSPEKATWTVGQLRANGLRIMPSGRSDASAVLNSKQFVQKEVQNAYWIAAQIPETLNKLYCWCGCENRGVHRSNLACFEDQMGVNCDVCRGTAEIAYEMTQQGITDAGKIQAAVDNVWARR